MVRRILPLVALAVLVGCGKAAQSSEQPSPAPQVIKQVVTQIVTQVVTQVVTATPKPSTPTPKATTVPTEVPTATPPPTGKWVSDDKSSSFDDSKTVTLLLDAEDEIVGPSGSIRPSLLVRCREHEKDVYIYTGMAPDVESGNFDGATVRVLFDKEGALTKNAGQSTSRDSLFFPDPEETIAAMLKHERMVFGFTPFDASPVEMTFDLRGLSEAIKPLNEACK
jgi:type VI secretion system protein VasI